MPVTITSLRPLAPVLAIRVPDRRLDLPTRLLRLLGLLVLRGVRA